MSLKINAYLRKSMDDDSSSADLGGDEGFISPRPSSSRAQSTGDENQPSSSNAGNQGLKAEDYRTDIHQSPEVSALQSLPTNGSADLGSVSPAALAAESNPEPSTSSPSRSGRSNGNRNREKPAGTCRVCGDVATGKYFGALVCVPCKTFFLRYNGEGFSFVCKNKQACDISVSTRIQCKYCRFQKCLAAGMTRKVRPPQVEPKEGKQLCVVCNDFGNGVHFGVVTCEGCKKFFRRGLVEHKSYVCKFNRCCPINPQTRNTCRYCRYNKCKSLGMSREAIQMGRPSKASQKQGVLRTAERQLDEEVMDVDEEPSSTQALDLSITPSNSTSQLQAASASHQPSTSSLGSPQASSSNGSSQPPSSSSSSNESSHSPSSYNGSSPPSSSYNGSSPPSSSYNGSSQPSSSYNGSSQPSSSYNGSSPPSSSYNGSSQPSSSYNGSSQPSSSYNGSSQPSSSYNGSSQPSSSYNGSSPPSYNGSSQPLSIVTNGMSQLSPSALSSSCNGSAALPSTRSLVALASPVIVSDRPSSKSSLFVESPRASPLASKLSLNSSLLSPCFEPPTSMLISYELPEPMPSSFSSTPCIPQPLASFSASSPSSSTSAISLGFKRGDVDSSETLLFASLPPSFQHNTCLAFDEVSDQIVPSCQLLNETQQALFQNLKLQAEGNLIENSFKRVTMIDLVDIFRGNKINVSNNKPNLWGSLKKLKDFSFYEGGKLRKHEGLYGHSDRWRSEVDDFMIEHKMRFRLNITKNYWLASLYPDENLHATDDKHLEIINMVVPNYGEFVSSSETINHNLTNNYREWVMQNGQNMTAAVISEWIKTSVIPSFTIVSVKYFKQIPGFKNFDTNDQMNIARLGQSPSRILAAVLHWFDPELNNFKDFLSWRDRIPGNSDRFKKYLIRFANNVQLLNMDAVEAALLNTLIIVASDYPNLVDPKVIESARTRLICTFRAYISTKYGASTDRMDKLFGIIPEIRKIGFLHHEMTNKKTMMAEEFGERLLKSFNF